MNVRLQASEVVEKRDGQVAIQERDHPLERREGVSMGGGEGERGTYLGEIVLGHG